MVKRKRGRPVKAGRRYPSGDRKPEDDHGGAMWRRIVDEGLAFGKLNPQLGTEIGRLVFHGKLTTAEAAAASRIAEIYGRYERIAGVRRSVKSPSYMVGFGGRDQHETAGDVLYSIRARKQYDKLSEHIPLFPKELRSRLEDLCVEDRVLGWSELQDVRALLRKLAEVFHMTASPSSPVEIGSARPRIRNRTALHSANR